MLIFDGDDMLHGGVWRFVIPPGGDVQFSIPVKHVSDDWYVLVPFEFMLDGAPTFPRQPSTEGIILDVRYPQQGMIEVRDTLLLNV